MIEEGYKATIDLMPQIMEIFKKRKGKRKKLTNSDIVFIK